METQNNQNLTREQAQTNLKPRKHMTLTQAIATGFAAIILLGAILLSLPIASRGGEALSFLDALFTAASATCVTGLVVCDTYTQFSFFGQIVILGLIQMGGLGFMTVVTFFCLAVGKRIGLAERNLLRESISRVRLGGVVRLGRRILIGTLLIEGMGAILLAWRFYPSMGMKRAVYNGVFHSISAFCNAGFDLLGRVEPYSSLMTFQNDVVVNITIMSLITIGGIGFVIWDDVVDKRMDFHRYSLQSKMVLSTTAALILFGTIAFALLEWNNTTMEGLTASEKILAASFQSVTPRTAGFNTIDIAQLTDGGTILTIILMFIGASPGSTGGGVKTITILIILITLTSSFRGKVDSNAFGRRIGDDAIRKAFSLAAFYTIVAMMAVFAIVVIQPLPVKDVLLECFSAIGTVGLSTGITRQLLPLSKVIIILLMYSGRVGSLTVVAALVKRRKEAIHVRLPEEKITVG